MGFSLKDILPHSLFGRSLLILIVPVLLIQIVTTYIFYERHWERMTKRLAHSVAGEIIVMANFVESSSNKEDISYMQKNMHKNLDITFRVLSDSALPDHKGTYHIFESMVVYNFSQELARRTKKDFAIDIDLEKKKIFVYLKLNNHVLKVEIPKRRLFSSSSYIFLLWMVGVSTLLVCIAVVFMKNQIKPIRKLAIAADRFGKGKESIALSPSGAREVRMAAQAFLDMRERITRQIQQRTVMLAGVSHDLRTPLTRMKLQLALMKGSKEIDVLSSDLEQMEKMIDGYLQFARGGQDEDLEENADINLLLSKSIEAVRDDNIQIFFEEKEDIRATLKPVAFQRCFVNLLNNAKKYANNIWVLASIDKETILVTIEDDGPGIPEEEYQEVFKPFYRVDDSRNLNTGGVGLGLPVAADIIHTQGGDIVLGKSSKGGLLVKVTLPQ